MNNTLVNLSRTKLNDISQERMTFILEEMVAILGEKLLSVVIYGSAIRDDFIVGRSNLNVLVITTILDVTTMKSVQQIISEARRNNIRLFLITEHDLQYGEDIFFSKFRSIKDANETVYGKDYFDDLAFDQSQLKWRVSQEVKEHLFHLRCHYIVSGGQELTNTMIRSLGRLIETLRVLLTIDGSNMRPRNEAVIAVSLKFNIDLQTLEKIEELKKRDIALPRDEAEKMYDAYLSTVAQIIKAIDFI